VQREYLKRGLDVPDFTRSDRPTISEAVAQFVKNQAALDKAESTVYGYTRAAEQFRDSCRRLYMDEIDRQTMIDHIGWLRENVATRSFGDQNNTIRTRLQYLSVFLRENGMTMPLAKRDWPKVEHRNPEAYTTEQVNHLLSKATEDERDLILFFLFTGFRDSEAAHTFWSDVNFKRGTINVSDKPEHGFRIKNRKQRKSDIMLPADFVERLRNRQEKSAADCALIFPNSNCKPDSALLARVRNAAKRAGFKERVTLHKFRKTFGTRYAEKYGIVNAQRLLGHADIRTTRGYLAETNIPRDAVESLFADIGK
jgi:integrase